MRVSKTVGGRLFPRNPRLSDEELLAGLREYARRVKGRRFPYVEFDRWEARPFCAATVLTRFGSWRVALGMVGIAGVRAREYDAAELLEEFERLWSDAGRRPTDRMVLDESRFSINAFRNKWRTVKRLGDLVSRYKRGEISRAAVLRAAGKSKRRKEVPLGVRWKVIERDGYRCVACGRSPATERGVELHVDHVRAVARGGGNEIANLRTLCSACNMGRGTGGTGGAGVRKRAA